MTKGKLTIQNRTVDAIFFHLPDEEHGWLSNWTLSDFELDGKVFSSVEQYIMYQKCDVFGDMESAQAVMATKDPQVMQTIGRNARGYIPLVWEGLRQVIAERAIYASFSQNDKRRQLLVDTEDAWLVECAHQDKIWTCGARINEPERFDASLWKGTNLLGFVLMKVREDLKAQSTLEKGCDRTTIQTGISGKTAEPVKEFNNSRIKIIKRGITKMSVDAIVNAANSGLKNGGGVAGAVFSAAGVNKLSQACDAIGGCSTGNAVITPGFDLPAKYIIHAVGPIWCGGDNNEAKLLYSAYKQSLIVAMKNDCHTVAFPLISAGIYGYPPDKAWRKALQACDDFIKSNPDYDIEITFAVIDDNILNLGEFVRRDLGI